MAAPRGRDASAQHAEAHYAGALSDYVRTRSEAALYRASLLSQQFVEQGLGPEDIIAVHAAALGQATAGLTFREQAHAGTDALQLQFLLEVMIAYGVSHKEYLDLRLREHTRELEEGAALSRARRGGGARGPGEE